MNQYRNLFKKLIEKKELREPKSVQKNAKPRKQQQTKSKGDQVMLGS